MDKCFIFTTLLLVYMVAVVYSRVSYECEKDEEKHGEKEGNLDFRLEFTSDTISDITNKQQYFCNIITKKSEKTIIQCKEREISCPILCSGEPSSWSSWSECITSGEGYKHRSLLCHSNQSACLVPSNGSSFEISKCIPASSTTEKENGKEAEKRYAFTEIILVALCCLLMGVILTTLVFVLYMKKTQRGCFSKQHIKDVQGDSKQQSGPDMQFLTDNVVVKKYDPNNSKLADSKNENKAEETQYQSLNSNQVGNNQQAYDELKVNEARSDRQGHQPSSIRLPQTGNDYQVDHTTNLQHKNEGVYEYCRDSDIDGHNYFVLERENMSQESATCRNPC